VSSDAASVILIRGARALASADSLGASLEILLDAIVLLDVESAVIVVADRGSDRLEIVASSGLPDAAVGGLRDALRNPEHPIARSFGDPLPSFDVLPTVPGGPALRSHLPLTVTRDGTETVLGVLALAHHRPVDPGSRQLIQATADLAAVALERHRPT
jgi:GAF domain-containing protein